jgi:hypothetical protein
MIKRLLPSRGQYSRHKGSGRCANEFHYIVDRAMGTGRPLLVRHRRSPDGLAPRAQVMITYSPVKNRRALGVSTSSRLIVM